MNVKPTAGLIMPLEAIEQTAPRAKERQEVWQEAEYDVSSYASEDAKSFGLRRKDSMSSLGSMIGGNVNYTDVSNLAFVDNKIEEAKQEDEYTPIRQKEQDEMSDHEGEMDDLDLDMLDEQVATQTVVTFDLITKTKSQIQ